PIEKWLDDFRRDEDPESEVAVWEVMAAAFTGYTAMHPSLQEQKKELLGILLAGSGAPGEEAITHLKLKEFTEAQAREALGILRAEWLRHEAQSARSSVP